jgi:hypothetical protein
VFSDRYEKISSFTLCYSNFSLNSFGKEKKIDLSDTLTKIIESNNGDAVVDLKVKGGYFDYWFVGACLTNPLTLGLLTPNNIKTEISGNVVKLKK